tara:strand:+ start:267 stop:479 length:213 start_codon:yes stop_codon:yes gene_type:complete
MNTSRLFVLKNDLIRLQKNNDTLEGYMKGFDLRQSEKYSESVKNQIFQNEEAYCNAMAELREIKSFLYGA